MNIIKISTKIVVTFRLLWIFLVIVALHGSILAKNDISIDEVRANLIEQFDKVEDYMVRVKVSVEMPKFRMPSKTIDVAFKQPDKLKVESTGFAIAPKSGMHFSPRHIFAGMQNPQVTGSDYFDRELHWVVTGEINPDSAQQVMGAPSVRGDHALKILLWVDNDRWVISRMETRAGDKTVMQTNVHYKRFTDGIWLPKQTQVEFTFPEGFMDAMPNHDDLGEELPAEPQKKYKSLGDKQEPIRGNVVMEFMNYKVNEGIKDSFFDNTDY